MKWVGNITFLILFIFLSAGCMGGGSSDDTKDSSNTIYPYNNPYTPYIPEDSTIDENISNDTSTDLNDTNNTVVSSGVRFSVKVPSFTPADEFICIYFDDWKPIKMQKIDTNLWQIDINSSYSWANHYRYVRNCEFEAAFEIIDNNISKYREFSYSDGTQIDDNVSKWRWLDSDLISKAQDVDIQTDYLQTAPDINNSEDFLSGVSLNDWWDKRWLDSVDTTLNKIAQLNSKWVEISPVPYMSSIYPPKIDINTSSNSISDDDLIYLIKTAHKYGLKVYLNPFQWAFIADTNTTHTQDWWNEFQNEWEPLLLHYAQLAQDNNVSLFGFKMWMNIEDIDSSEASKMDTNSSKLFDKVKDIFSGKIAVESTCTNDNVAILDVFKKADYLALKIWPHYPWSSMDDNGTDVDGLKTFFSSKFDSCRKYFTDNNLTQPVIIRELTIHSYKDVLASDSTAGEMQTSAFGETNSSIEVDFDIQAKVYEAVLYNVSQKDWLVGNFAFTYFYWDSLDKEINIRAKPAQEVMSKWYRWLNP